MNEENQPPDESLWMFQGEMFSSDLLELIVICLN
jgi:hypothetical protein